MKLEIFYMIIIDGVYTILISLLYYLLLVAYNVIYDYVHIIIVLYNICLFLQR